MKNLELSNDEFNLFNPPFVSLVVGEAVDGFQVSSGKGLDYPLSFLACGLVLTKDVRANLPSRTTTSFINWVKDNPSIRAKFPVLVQSQVPVVKAGILWGLSKGHLGISNGALTANITVPKDHESINVVFASETRECWEKAHFVGKWFAKLNSTKTAFAMLGVRP